MAKKVGCKPGTYRSGDKCIPFKSVHFMTALEKTRVQKQYKNLLKAVDKREVKPTQFPKSLYEHLHLHCGFIAHFSRHGFYQTYFVRPADTKEFLDTMMLCSHSGSNEYRDINQALQNETIKKAPDINKKMDDAIKYRDIALAKALFKKHGVKY